MTNKLIYHFRNPSSLDLSFVKQKRMKSLFLLEGEILGKVVFDGRDDGLNELEEDDEIHVNTEFAATLHDLEKNPIGRGHLTDISSTYCS